MRKLRLITVLLTIFTYLQPSIGSDLPNSNQTDNESKTRNLRRITDFDAAISSWKVLEPSRNYHPQRDEMAIISYEDQDALEFFVTSPNEWDDYNFYVHFTPEEAPYRLVGIRVALFNMEGDAGEPGMLVRITESDDDGFPGEEIDEFEVSSDDLTLSNFNEIEYNEIIFDDYDLGEISFDERIDFSIVLNVIQGDEEDTLAIFLDDARRQPSDRSGFADFMGDWMTMREAYENGHNLAICAIVDYHYDEEPEIEIDPDEIDFGNVIVDETETQALTISNEGGEDLEITGLELDNEVFNVIIEGEEEEEEDNHFPNANSDRNHAILIWEALLFDEALEVGDEVAVITPGGLCAGSIKLTEDDDPEEPFGLAAWGDNPDTEDEVEGFVEDEELTFLFWDASSSVEVVAEAEYMNGPERWRRDGMSRVRLAGDEIFWFQIILEPDESVEIPVTFHPVEIAEYEGTLTIVSNDPDAEEVTVNLFGGGRGVNSPELNNPIEDVEIDEDSGEQIIVDLDDVFIDPDEDVLRYEIIASIEELNLSIAKETNELIIETALNWNGEAEVVIQASDGIEREQAALDTFLVIVNPVNDLPSPFDLEGPEDDAEVADYPTVSFSWGESFDEIEADTVTYGLLLTWNNTDHWYQDIESASIEIHRDDLCVDSNQATELEWKVFAYDSEDSVESDHTFQLTIAPLSVTNADNELPEEFSLSPVYPNPFNPSAQIDFALPQTTNIKLTVWDAAGRHLNVIASGQFPAGYHNVTWHANNLPTGVYIFSLETEEIRLVTKGILIR